MSIEVTQFKYANDTNHKSEHNAEILSWLQENGSKYFDSITASDEEYTSIVCSVDGSTFTISGMYNKTEQLMELNNSKYVKYGSVSANPIKSYRYGIKTDYGLYLASSGGSNTPYYGTASTNAFADIVITKNSNRNTSVICWTIAGLLKLSHKSGDFYAPLIGADLTKSNYFSIYFTENRSTDASRTYAGQNHTIFSAPSTSLEPFVFDNGAYTEHLFLSHITQCSGLSHKKVLVDGLEYWTNGVIYLQ